jgi:hypothetical protein
MQKTAAFVLDGRLFLAHRQEPTSVLENERASIIYQQKIPPSVRCNTLPKNFTSLQNDTVKCFILHLLKSKDGHNRPKAAALLFACSM